MGRLINLCLFGCSLWKNDVGNDGSWELARALKSNDTLKALNLKDNGVDVEFEEELCIICEDKVISLSHHHLLPLRFTPKYTAAFSRTALLACAQCVWLLLLRLLYFRFA